MSSRYGYDPPEVKAGDRVMVDATPGWRQPCLGLCLAVKGDGSQVDVVYFAGGGYKFRYDCLHRSDPMCKELPQRFDPGIAGEINGVWDIAPQEAEHRSMLVRIAKLEGEVFRLLQAEVRRKEIAIDSTEPKLTPPAGPVIERRAKTPTRV